MVRELELSWPLRGLPLTNVGDICLGTVLAYATTTDAWRGIDVPSGPRVLLSSNMFIKLLVIFCEPA